MDRTFRRVSDERNSVDLVPIEDTRPLLPWKTQTCTARSASIGCRFQAANVSVHRFCDRIVDRPTRPELVEEIIGSQLPAE